MIYGATGAIGSSYVQFCKYYGVYNTAVCRGEHHDLIRSLGADKVIDYKTQDFTKDNERYDYIFDAVGRTGYFKCKHLLKEKGIYSSSGGFEYLLLAIFTPMFGRKKVIFLPPKEISQTLSFIKELVEQRKFRPVIDRKYPLEEIAEAYKYVATGQKVGNVVIEM